MVKLTSFLLILDPQLWLENPKKTLKLKSPNWMYSWTRNLQVTWRCLTILMIPTHWLILRRFWPIGPRQQRAVWGSIRLVTPSAWQSSDLLDGCGWIGPIDGNRWNFSELGVEWHLPYMLEEGRPIGFPLKVIEGSSLWLCGYVNLKDGPGIEYKAYDYLNSFLSHNNVVPLLNSGYGSVNKNSAKCACRIRLFNCCWFIAYWCTFIGTATDV